MSYNVLSNISPLKVFMIFNCTIHIAIDIFILIEYMIYLQNLYFLIAAYIRGYSFDDLMMESYYLELYVFSNLHINL